MNFIQIGSNIGVMETDFVSKLILEEQWEGVLVEPVPWLFEQLRKNYQGREGLFFENVAVSGRREERDLYIVDPHKVPKGKDGLYVGAQWSSFSQEHVKKCPGDLPDSYFTKIKVDCVPISDLVSKYSLHDLDLLHIDAEGAEAQILESIDFCLWKPKMIVFEHVHMLPDTYFSLMQLLGRAGYDLLATEELDTILSLR